MEDAQINRYDSLLDAINALRKKGYTHDFNLKEESLQSDNIVLRPKDFKINEFHRFEGESNPDDSSILYAIESHEGIKGILVNGWGMYSEATSAEMVEKLKIAR